MPAGDLRIEATTDSLKTEGGDAIEEFLATALSRLLLGLGMRRGEMGLVGVRPPRPATPGQE
jgi:hypothetical protein